MIQPRDDLMLKWLDEFIVATSSHIAKIFYNNNIKIANKRLLSLTKDKIIYRCKDPWSKQYVYSLKPIKSKYQLKHSYIRNEFYIKLLDMGCQIKSFKVQKKFAMVVPDLCIQFIYKSKTYMYFVEIERSEQKINVSKYNEFFKRDYEEYITTPIPVVYITHKTVPKNTYNHIKVQLDLSDIQKIL